MLDFAELLKLRGLDCVKSRTKVVRHASSKYELSRLSKDNHLPLYEAVQSDRVFECEYIVSCLGEERTRSRFLWVCRVEGVTETKGAQWPNDYPFPEMTMGRYRYDLRRLEGFDDLEGRVIIDWGRSTRSWHQWLEPGSKAVLELRPTGYVRAFPGYDEVILTFDELCEIVKHPDANIQWHERLKRVAGVYLITDSETGRQYIGSATGEGGILARWAQYAVCKHGGNVLLQELVKSSPNAVSRLCYSILRTFPASTSRDEVLEFEHLYKRKLGSRAHGLNAN